MRSAPGLPIRISFGDHNHLHIDGRNGDVNIAFNKSFIQQHHLHIDGCNGDVSDNAELTTVVQMLILQSEKVPNKPEQ